MNSDAEVLNEYSTDVAQRLFAVYPEWRQYSQVLRSKHGSGNYLYVEVPAPDTSAAGALQIWTELDDSHVVFRDVPQISWLVDEYDFPDMIPFLSDLLSDSITFAVYFNGNSWAHTQLLHPGENPEKCDAERVRVFSWSGKKDREMRCDAL